MSLRAINFQISRILVPPQNPPLRHEIHERSEYTYTSLECLFEEKQNPYSLARVQREREREHSVIAARLVQTQGKERIVLLQSGRQKDGSG